MLKRGETWREQLIPPSSGTLGYPIIFGAYGSGNKPRLFGSINKNKTIDWFNENSDIWVIAYPETSEELLSNPSFDVNDNGWYFYSNSSNQANANGSRDISVYDSFPASYSVKCVKSGVSFDDLQLNTKPLAIESGGSYKLTFRAKATIPFTIPEIYLHKDSSPWTSYTSDRYKPALNITPDWNTYTVLFRVSTSADDAQITFYLGSALPSGSNFYIDTLSFKRITDFILADVGNMIFNNESFIGRKVWSESNLINQGDFWYDENSLSLKIFSTSNPGSYYSTVECALNKHIILIDSKSYIVIENLELRYGGAHAIYCSQVDHITIRNCDISYIGGASQYGGNQRVRYGNGIEFLGSASNCVVEKCRLREIYDAALTNQGSSTNNQSSIYFRYNIIWNSEYSYEYWNGPETSTTQDIHFENNTCFNAGGGWGHLQRTDPSGRHLCFYINTAQTVNMYIRNNIFYKANDSLLYISSGTWNGLNNLTLDYNCWYQPSGILINYQGTTYTPGQFSIYQIQKGKDIHSIQSDPKLIDVNNYNFRLLSNSPCIDAGINIGLTTDYDGSPVPQGPGVDIGAFEYYDITPPKNFRVPP